MIKFSVVRDSHQTEFCKGLTNLQHNEEFVDMTIAVDGHMIKVHQNVVALASPYLREILKSVPCRHPVLFLNGMKHDIFCLILEYVYLGAVMVPRDKMNEFIAVAANLQISGLANFIPEDITHTLNNDEPELIIPETNGSTTKQLGSLSTKNINKPINILTDFKFSNNDQTRKYNSYIENTAATEFITDNYLNVPDNNHDTESSQFLLTSNQNTHNNYANKYSNIDSNVQYSKLDIQQTNRNTGITNEEPQLNVQPMDYSDMNLEKPQIHYNISFDVNGQSTLTLLNDNKDPVNIQKNQNSLSKKESYVPEKKTLKNTPDCPKFTISKRGNLQLILNCFLYSLHQSNRGEKKRWRCVNYRRESCPAYIDTEGDTIVARKNYHKHAFHDELLEKKAQNNLFFTSFKQAVIAKKEEQEIKLRAKENLKRINNEIAENK